MIEKDTKLKHYFTINPIINEFKLINKQKKFAKSTLGGCIVEDRDNFVLISKELKTKKSTLPTYKARF